MEFRRGSWIVGLILVIVYLAIDVYTLRDGDAVFTVIFGVCSVVLLIMTGKAFLDARRNDPVVMKGTLTSTEYSGFRMKGYIVNEANEIYEFSFYRRHDELFQSLLWQPVELTIARRSKELIKCVIFDKKGA